MARAVVGGSAPTLMQVVREAACSNAAARSVRGVAASIAAGSVHDGLRYPLRPPNPTHPTWTGLGGLERGGAAGSRRAPGGLVRPRKNPTHPTRAGRGGVINIEVSAGVRDPTGSQDPLVLGCTTGLLDGRSRPRQEGRLGGIRGAIAAATRASTGLRAPRHAAVAPTSRPQPSSHHLPLMGIINSISPRHARHVTSSSLPLMGIINLRSPPAARSRPCCPAHYPSWGLSTWDGGASLMSAMNSLPLMGIINPRACCSRGRARQAHYPSWGLSTGCVAPATLSTSPFTHYPSWGLSTRGGRHPRRASTSTHYPSWGLSTRRWTPAPRSDGSSLPLMGIINWIPTAAPYRSRRPHYPSWGLSTGCRLYPLTGQRCTHYPSWGLSTICVLGTCRAIRRLITPHGDYQLEHLLSYLALTLAPHYPSCGLSTASPESVDGGIVTDSLPLMGIINSSVETPLNVRGPPRSLPLMGIINPLGPDAGEGGPDNSLPLMGIINEHARALGLIQLKLITPHGDYQQAAAVAAAGDALVLITPHGDYQRVPVPHPACDALALITPHGDYQPHAAQRLQRDPVRLITPHGDYQLTAQCPVGEQAPVLITPHGDYQRADLREQRPSDDALITPHGDYQLAVELGQRRAADGLIAPHGDYQPALALPAGTSLLRSLPLMGIINQDTDEAPRFRADSSLPLMGIINRLVSRSTVSVSRSSLPLMGIINPGLPSFGRRRCHSHSLPLMGIINSGR